MSNDVRTLGDIAEVFRTWAASGITRDSVLYVVEQIDWDAPNRTPSEEFVPEPVTLEKLAEIVKRAATQGMGGHPHKSLLKLAGALEEAHAIEVLPKLSGPYTIQDGVVRGVRRSALTGRYITGDGPLENFSGEGHQWPCRYFYRGNWKLGDFGGPEGNFRASKYPCTCHVDGNM